MSRLLTIGQVVNSLTPEFADLSISKLRYLEDQGLVTPMRTSSGYRKYSEDDIRRLRYILTAQRDRYLPLRVIRAELDRLAAMAGADDDGPAVPAVQATGTALADGPVVVTEPPAKDTPAADQATAGPGSAAPAPAAGEPDRTLRELAEHLGLDIKQLRQLRDNGLISEDEPYGAAEQRIARWAMVLLNDGLEARHLRMYLQFVDREVAMVEQLVQPLLRQRNPQASTKARLLASDLGEASTRLHGALLSRALEAVLEG